MVAYSFPSAIRPLVTFQENYFLRDTLQVILVLMIPISSFYHVRGLRKRAVRQTDFGYYYILIDKIMIKNKCCLKLCSEEKIEKKSD